MRLLTYTRYLWRKIKFYDNLANTTKTFLQNPFLSKDKSMTIVWVEDDDSDAFFKM